MHILNVNHPTILRFNLYNVAMTPRCHTAHLLPIIRIPLFHHTARVAALPVSHVRTVLHNAATHAASPPAPADHTGEDSRLIAQRRIAGRACQASSFFVRLPLLASGRTSRLRRREHAGVYCHAR
jgi:hypothetical protein